MRSGLKYALAVFLLLTMFESRSEPLEKPRIFPDYSDVTIPPNIAPLNFLIQEKGSGYSVKFIIGNTVIQEIKSRNAEIQIPERAWKKLLQIAKGTKLIIKISVFNGGWKECAPITNHVAKEEIDPWIVYRYLKPLYMFYHEMSIRQRNLESFDEKIVLRSERFDRGCLNCHTFLNHSASAFAFHVRKGKEGNPMILSISNSPSMVEKTSGYLSWHPSGRALAFSMNKLSLFFHATDETRDVFDEDSNLGIYRIDNNTISTPSAIANPELNETWPCWSADGKYLYYCVAKKAPIKNYREIKYDLARISYDIETDTWGEPEVLISSKATGLSVHQPKVSPDSRFVLIAMSEYGNFPVYRPDSDLFLLDASARHIKRLELNSEASESWHCWSSNGRWILFSSKRMDGVFARPHISYFDTNHVAHKPFVLPQKDPMFYLECIHTFNVPEFINGPITVTENSLLNAINGKSKIVKPLETGDKNLTDTPQKHYGSKPQQKNE